MNNDRLLRIIREWADSSAEDSRRPWTHEDADAWNLIALRLVPAASRYAGLNPDKDLAPPCPDCSSTDWGHATPCGRKRAPDEPSPNVAYTYDVVAYNASWAGYGDNASKEGFETPEAAIAYAKSCGAHLDATVWKRTKPIPVERVSVQIYPPVKSGADRG